MKSKRINIYKDTDQLLYNYINRVQSSSGSLEKAKRVLHSVISEQLNENQANVVSMYYFENLKQKDIAQRLGIDQSTVSRTLTRARNTLSRFLKYLL